MWYNEEGFTAGVRARVEGQQEHLRAGKETYHMAAIARRQIKVRGPLPKVLALLRLSIPFTGVSDGC